MAYDSYPPEWPEGKQAPNLALSLRGDGGGGGGVLEGLYRVIMGFYSSVITQYEFLGLRGDGGEF